MNMKNPVNISGHLHITGKSKFVGDEMNIANLHYAKMLFSKQSHARIKMLDLRDAESLEGVVGIITYENIPGENQIGHVMKDEPLLPIDEVFYYGQPIAIVVAKTPRIAEIALSKIKIEYEPLESILTIDKAIENDSYYIAPRYIKNGNVDEGFKQADFILEGEFECGGQEHFYMETQRCLAVPDDDGGITLYSATQATAEVQEIAAHILGINSSKVTVDVLRLGGAFGGKERGATLWSCLAAVASYTTNLPVELKLNREEDIQSTGKRHPYKAKYKAGFTNDGKIVSYDTRLYSNGGYYSDLSVAILERAMLHSDNAYFIPNISIAGYACKTNLPPNTAFRGFGGPQGIFAIESILEKAAMKLEMDKLEIRKINTYKSGQQLPYKQTAEDIVIPKFYNILEKKYKYSKRKSECAKFNVKSKFIKKGVGIVPVKFGISFTTALLNQASALVWVYTDGTISLSHCGIEMGQGINTKMMQIAADELGISFNRIRVESSNTKRTGNASPTAASTGTDLNGSAVKLAVQKIKSRLKKFAVSYIKNKFGFEPLLKNIVFSNDTVFDKTSPDNSIGFSELVHQAYLNRVALGAHGYYRTPGIFFDREKGEGTPFFYFSQGVCMSEVEVDILTGMFKLKSVNIVHDMGNSVNFEIDKGQIAGAFFQGFGWCTFEEITNDASGRYLAVTPSTYKIPTITDLPEKFEIEAITRKTKFASVNGSKGIGEPPLIYGESVYFAIKDAIESIKDYKVETNLKMPATPEAVLMAIENLK